MNTQEFKRKMTAVFSADVAGYSRLMGDDEAATVKTLESYKQIMFSLIKQHRGRVIDSPGDNLLAEFASVVDAVQCGVAVQKELQARNAELPENRKMLFRIGINLGDVIEEQDRIYGDGVNIAARLESCADPGGICVSKTAFDHIESKLPLGYEYLGEKEVKNIAKPVGAYRVLMEPRVTVAGAKARAPKIPLWRHKTVLAGAIVVLVAVIGAGVWNFYFRSTEIEPASKEKMAFPLPDNPSIAVLPFVNMSEDKSQEYFSDGLTEEIITALSKTPKLFVIARNSSFVYKGKPVNVQQVSRELGVKYVLEGSVRRSGDQLRITAQLIDATTGNHLWAERYDRSLGQIFSLQDEITLAIVKAMRVTLTEGEQANLTGKGTTNLDAYLKALEANEQFFRMNREGSVKAKQLAREAISLDPKYAFPHAIMANANMLDLWFGFGKSPQESMKLASEAAHKALSLDNSDPIIYSALSNLYIMQRQYDQAIASAERAVELCPSGARAHFTLGTAYLFACRPAEAVRSLELAIRLNPFPPGRNFSMLGSAYRMLGRDEEAIAVYKKGLQAEPGDLFTHLGLTVAYFKSGREDEASKQAAEVMKLHPKFSLDDFGKIFHLKDQSIADDYIASLRKAGLK
jgi:adenylate cyclase